jgi:pimeloyl-ACP methyl ester carboxylesterase
MASDVLAVMNALHFDRVALVGWSDGACTALILAAKYPSRVAGVFFFACNMDPTGVKPFEAPPARTVVSRATLRTTRIFQLHQNNSSTSWKMSA